MVAVRKGAKRPGADNKRGEANMAEDWALDVKKYVPNADDTVIAAIVRYCGIALRSRDASLVSFTDSTETDRVRENYCKKKLGLTDPHSVLDAAIAAVGERMKGDSTRNRVTVYYLLAEHFGKLGLFGAATDMADDPVAAAPLPLMAAAAAPVAVAAKKDEHRAPAGAVVEESGWMEYLPMAVLLLGGAALFALIIGNKPAPAPAPVAVVAAAEPIPTGAGITEAVVDGKPSVSVYFDTAKFDIYPNFDARTEKVRNWLAEHPGTHLQLSGFNDPRGDKAFNEELSKNRAFAVRDALAKLGVPLTAMDLVKPAETTDTADTLAVARRVDVTVEDGPVPAGEAAVEPSPAAVAADEPTAP
jgi:outer membrane protein OmpA-like peptidoglycan-associated protein